MNTLQKWSCALLCIAMLCLGCEWHGRSVMQAKWNQAIVERKAVNEIAITKQVAKNQARAAQQKLAAAPRQREEMPLQCLLPPDD